DRHGPRPRPDRLRLDRRLGPSPGRLLVEGDRRGGPPRRPAVPAVTKKRPARSGPIAAGHVLSPVDTRQLRGSWPAPAGARGFLWNCPDDLPFVGSAMRTDPSMAQEDRSAQPTRYERHHIRNLDGQNLSNPLQLSGIVSVSLVGGSSIMRTAGHATRRGGV